LRGYTHGYEKPVSNLFIIPVTLIAVTLGLYCLNTSSTVKNPAIEKTEVLLSPKVKNDSIESISLYLESAELDQLKTLYSKRTDPTGSLGTKPDLFIDADDYTYQRHNNELINVGEVKDADASSYQRDDSEVINAG
jgi:hypothetical protein